MSFSRLSGAAHHAMLRFFRFFQEQRQNLDLNVFLKYLLM